MISMIYMRIQEGLLLFIIVFVFSFVSYTPV